MATKLKTTKESPPKTTKVSSAPVKVAPAKVAKKNAVVEPVPVSAPVKVAAAKSKATPAKAAAPPAKTAVKPAAKVVSKPAQKAEAKPVAKGSEKVVQKPVAAKMAEKVVAKAAEKPAPKAASKTAPKTSAKVESVAEPVAPVIAPIAQSGDQDAKWQEIRVILEKLKEDTLREIRKSVKNGTEAVAAIEPGGDIYDQASSERDRELGLLLGDREREKIHSIDEALLRIDEGDYGICEECDEDIPLGRLRAMPFTRHCVKCKSDLEKLQAQTKRVEEERAYREIPLGSEDEES